MKNNNNNKQSILYDPVEHKYFLLSDYITIHGIKEIKRYTVEVGLKNPKIKRGVICYSRHAVKDYGIVFKNGHEIRHVRYSDVMVYIPLHVVTTVRERHLSY